jgi:prevent-host-death family protein
MIKVNIADAKVHLSRYLEKVEAGETVLICRRNVPVAELRAVASTRRRPRPFGLARGELTVPDDFDEPLPDDVIEAWYG